MKELNDLVEAAEKVVANCPWTSTCELEEYVQHIKSEVDEILAAIEHDDNENLQEEVGDLLWDSLTLVFLAERYGKTNSKKAMQDVLGKMKRRKPFIFEGRTVTLKEAEEYWENAKQKEKSLHKL